VAREPVDGAAAGVERHLPGALRRACQPPHPVPRPAAAPSMPVAPALLGFARQERGPLRRRPACACARAEKRKKPKSEASFRWAASVFGCIGPQNPSRVEASPRSVQFCTPSRPQAQLIWPKFIHKLGSSPMLNGSTQKKIEWFH
jgi:hypothetical protein